MNPEKTITKRVWGDGLVASTGLLLGRQETVTLVIGNFIDVSIVPLAGAPPESGSAAAPATSATGVVMLRIRGRRPAIRFIRHGSTTPDDRRPMTGTPTASSGTWIVRAFLACRYAYALVRGTCAVGGCAGRPHAPRRPPLFSAGRLSVAKPEVRTRPACAFVSFGAPPRCLVACLVHMGLRLWVRWLLSTETPLAHSRRRPRARNAERASPPRRPAVFSGGRARSIYNRTRVRPRTPKRAKLRLGASAVRVRSLLCSRFFGVGPFFK